MDKLHIKIAEAFIFQISNIETLIQVQVTHKQL